MAERLGGKVALITGAGSVGPGWGNGRAAAVLFAREGARVVAVDRDTKAAEATRQIIESEGNACAVETADVTDSAQIERVISEVCEHWGGLHVLVNNVGGSVPGGPVELSEEDWAGQLEFNLTSAFLTTRCVLPIMEDQGGGAIVNISSVAGLRFVGNHHAAYAAAKAGLVQFTKAVAVQYAARGVRCNSISVGLMHTPWWRPALLRSTLVATSKRWSPSATPRCPWAAWARAGTWPTPRSSWLRTKPGT